MTAQRTHQVDPCHDDLVTAASKVCPLCPERGPQPWENFYARARNSDGTMARPLAYCKPCMRDYQRRTTKPAHRRRANRRYWAKTMRDPERVGIRNAKRREAYKGTAVYHREQAGGEVACAPILAALRVADVTIYEAAQRIGRDAAGVRKWLKRETVPLALARDLLAAIDVLPAEIDL